MSATLGALLRELEPTWSVTLFEKLDAAAAESSDPWNNAGTGHSALCELNYTPREANGDVNIDKAVTINEQFQVSRQFWAHAVDNGILRDPSEFINPIPHVSYTHGADGVDYLRSRYDKLSRQTLFEGMEFITDPGEFADRLPLMAAGRDYSDPVALNWYTEGTDIDFGALTQQLVNYVGQGADIFFAHTVTNLSKQSDGTWDVTVRNNHTGEKRKVNAKFVFVGAGGGALHLLQRSGIKEINGYPVETLNDPEVLELKNGYSNALSHYLAGFLYEVLGESGLAAPGYRKAIELKPNTGVLEEGLRGLDTRTSFTWKRRQRMTDVLFLVEAGDAPARKPKAFTLPVPTGRGLVTASISYPVIEPSKDGRFVGVLSADDLLIDLASDLAAVVRPIGAEVLFGHRDSSVPATT